jgi:AmmeMemoRadiSam system protein B
VNRKPAVSGYFYPGREKELLSTVGSMIDHEMKKEHAICIVSPHAGFVYSGPVAGAVFSSVQLPENFIILGPSHRYMTSRVAISKKGQWETPLGRVAIESRLAEIMMSQSSLVSEDAAAHAEEHSLEVQLPFIQYFKKDFSIVPLCLSPELGFNELVELGKSISRSILEFNSDVMLVASTDMSHYVTQKTAEEKDNLAIEKILNLDPKGMHDIVLEEKISMCGYQPTTSAIVASNELGARKAELVKYQTSGDSSGDYSQVVGYAGIRIS